MKKLNDEWTSPEALYFSGTYNDVDPYVSADGKRLYFSSMRPLSGDGQKKDSDLWYAEIKPDGSLSKPIHPGPPNSPGKDDYYTSIAADGTIYFSIFEAHGSPGDIFYAQKRQNSFSMPKKLPPPISTSHSEHDPFIAPDGSYLIFTSDRPGGFGRGDLYITFRNENRTWSEPLNMGPQINTDGYDYCPMLSPDGKYLFFTRNINQNGDIYWVDSGIIDRYRPPR